MARTGTNYTAKWELVDGTLTISPVSGNSGAMRTTENINLFGTILRRDTNDDSKGYVTLTEDEMLSVDKIIFVGDISFFTWAIVMSGGYSYVRQPWFANFFRGFSNLTYIDLRGLNTSSATSFSFFFSLSSLTTIIGLDELDTSGCDDYSSMFAGSKVQELDVSTFENMNTAKIEGMFYNLRYCTTITLPSYFHRDDITYGIGIVPNGGTITNQQGVTIASEEDFFAFSNQYGEWTRNISGSTDLYFRVKKVSRDGNDVTIDYSYATTSVASVDIYIKESNQSSYPTTPTQTLSLTIGSGESSTTFAVSSDEGYDVQIITTDGTTTIYSFPSIDSNILLLEIDNQGNLESYGDITAGGDITDGSGNVLSDKANTSDVPTKTSDLTNDSNFVGFETGTATAGSVTWEYRKWANGELEMWGSGITTLNIDTAVGNIYTTANEYNIAVPSFVDSVDFVTGELSGGGWVDVTGYGVPPKMRFYAPTAYTSTDRYLRYYLKGTWS